MTNGEWSGGEGALTEAAAAAEAEAEAEARGTPATSPVAGDCEWEGCSDV